MHVESEELEEECENKLLSGNLNEHNLKFPYKMHPVFPPKHYVILFSKAHDKICQKY